MFDSIETDRIVCPVPLANYDHSAVGARQRRQIDGRAHRASFLPGGSHATLAALEDQATLDLVNPQTSGSGDRAPRIALTTDSFVVRPLFFSGGDIGKLAVHGTVNDLAVGGAIPLFLSAAFILEEGLPIDDLKRIVASMRCGMPRGRCHTRDRRY